MTSTAEETDFSQYNGKKVTVVRKLDKPNDKGESSVEVECVVQVGNANGLLVKPKGKVQFDLIKADEIEEVYMTPEKSKPLTAAKIKPVTIGQARRHLLERHGVTLEWANSVSEEDALKYHDSLDHVELKLGHIHVEKDDKEKPVEEASE